MTTGRYAVRPATHTDLAVLVGFTLAEGVEAEGRQTDLATITRAVASALEDPHLAQYWVLLETATQEPVGSASAFTEWSDWNAAPYWWVQSIYLRP